MATRGGSSRGRRSGWAGALSIALGAIVSLFSPSAEADRQGASLAASIVDPGAAGGQDAQPSAKTSQVILLTLDGVRWQDVFTGVDARLARSHGVPEAEVVSSEAMLPNIHARLVARGTVIGAPGKGEPVLTSSSALSLPGYLELLTGRRDGPCNSNRCLPVAVPTILDAVRSQPGAGDDAAAAIASWETIALAASAHPTKVVISAGRRHGWPSRERVRVDDETSKLLDEASKVGPAPGHEDYRPDRFTGELALRYLEARRPKAMFIGLGDTDEWAHADDYRSYLKSLREADDFVGKLFSTLDAMGEYGASTTVILTTDHGRGRDFIHHGRVAPESRKVFVMAAGGAVPARGIVAADRPHRLADIAPTVRSLLGLPADANRQAGAPIAELLPPPPVASTKQALAPR